MRQSPRAALPGIQRAPGAFERNCRHAIQAMQREVKLGKQAKEVMQRQRLNSMKLHMTEWRLALRELLAEGQHRHLAIGLFMRHMFKRLARATKID